MKSKMLFHVYVDQKMHDHFKNRALSERKFLSTLIREELAGLMELDLEMEEVKNGKIYQKIRKE